jgi:autotransporter-associated beta strand protein
VKFGKTVTSGACAARRLRAVLLASSALCAVAAPALAQDATWLAAPGSGDFNTAANWSTATVPAGTASFGLSSTTGLSFSATTAIGGWTFNPGASAYTFTNGRTVDFNGAGIVVNGGSAAITNTVGGIVNFRNASTAGSATIANNGGLAFNDTSTAGSAGITNTAFLNFNNASTAGNATITNGNTGFMGFSGSAGSATIVNNNFLSFAGTAGSATITTNAFTLFLGTSTAGSAAITTNTGGFTLFFGASSGGNAAITTNAGGSTQFFGTSSGGNARFITNASGALDISGLAAAATGMTAGSIEGAGAYYLGSKQLTVGSNGLNTTVSGVISNCGSGTDCSASGATGGSLVKVGTGALTLTGVNTYTGGTTINAGTLQLGNGGATGAILGAVTVGGSGTFNVVNADTSGITSISNAGATNFRNGTSAGSATITNNSGFTQFFNTSTASNAGITNNAHLKFRDTSAAGHATITNNSDLNFNETSSAGNATIANNGLVRFFGASTAGSAAITNGAAGVTDFSLSSGPNGDRKLSAGSIGGGGTFSLGQNELTVGGNNLSTTVTGVIADGGLGGGTGGSLVKAGTGTLTLTGTNTYTGGTTINAGTLQLGNGGTSGSILGSIALAGGNFAVDRSDAVTLDGAISGSGSFSQIGTGNTILTAASTYTGATIVNAGTLSVNGSISNSNVTVNAGGMLGGNGAVGNTTINGGTLAPGNSIGLLTVQGNLVLTAAATYMVEVSPVNADRTNVTGVATLGGAAVKASFAAGSYVSKQYTIINATGGVSGTLSAEVDTNLPANFHTALGYDANNVFLNLILNFGLPSPLQGNQANVGTALTNFFNGTGGIPMAFAALSPAGLTQASGEVATGSQQTTFDAMNLFMGLLTDPFVAGRGDPVTSPAGASQFAEENDSANAYASKDKPRSGAEREAYAAIYRKALVMADPFAQRWSVWAAGYGGSQTTDGNTAQGSNAATSRLYGTAVGADYRFSPNTLAGFALAGGGTNFSIAHGLGSGRSDLFQAGAFVRHTFGPAYLSGALAYGWQDVTTDRIVTVAGVDQLRANFNANAFSGRVEGGYRFVTPWTVGVGVTPYAAGQFTTFDLPAYAEQVLSGANTFALAYASKSVTASRSELGIRTEKSFAMQSAILTLRGRFAWAHDFNPDRSMAATFQTLPGASFVVNGAAQAHDSALTTASAEMKWRNGWSAAATFEGEFSSVTRSYAGKGALRYAW